MQRRNLTLFLGLAAVLSGIARASIETTVPAPVGARLVGLDLPGRIAGSFFVILKSDADLSAFDTASPTTSTSAKAAALPGQNDVEPVEAPTPPTSVPDLVQRFGTDLANRMPGATLFSAYAVGDYKAVVIHGASDNLIKSIAANDPRIEEIGANFEVLEASVPNPQNPAKWFLSRLSNGPLPPLGSNFPNSYTFDNTAKGVRVYIVDSGIRTSHTEFGGRAGTLVLDCVALVGGKCTRVPQNTPNANQDCDGHGTHVASNVGGTIYGAAKEVNLAGFIAVKSGNLGQQCDSVDSAGVKIALQYIIGIERFHWSGPQVINMSLAGQGIDPQEDALLAQAMSVGLVVVVGVPDFRDGHFVAHIADGYTSDFGEDPCNGSTAVTPSHVAGIIAVGGTDYVRGYGGTIAINSNDFYDYAGYGAAGWDIGSCISVFAPGVDVWGATNYNDAAYNSLDGTSFATALVSGMAAMYLQTHAHATQAEVKSAIQNAALGGQIIGCSIDDPTGQLPSGDHYLGDGYCPLTAPNRLAHLPLPVGTDIANGQTIGGSPWQEAIKKILAWFTELLS